MESVVRFERVHRRKKTVSQQNHLSVDNSKLSINCFPPYWDIPRVFDFILLRNFLDATTALRIATASAEYFMTYARKTAIARYQVFVVFMKVASSIKAFHQEKFNLNSDNGKKFWIESVKACEQIILENPNTKLTTKAELKNSLFLLLDEFCSLGLAPHVATIPMPRNYHYVKKNKPSLLENRTVQSKSNNADKDSDKDGFLDALMNSVNPSIQNDNMDVYQSLLIENRERLAKFRLAAESRFKRWEHIYIKGQELIKAAPASTLIDFQKYMDSKGKSADLYAKMFPKDNLEISTGNLLKIISCLYQGQFPNPRTIRYWKVGYQAVISRCGGLFYLDGMLAPHRECVAASIFLYLIDTGANVSTALNLQTDFEEFTDESNYVKVSSFKPRSNNKNIYYILPVKMTGVSISTVHALRFIRDAYSLRRANFPRFANRLFCFKYFSGLSSANIDFIAAQVKYLLKEFDLPSYWTVSAIRQSFAMEVMRRDGGTLASVARKLHHSTIGKVTADYALSYPVKGLLEEHIRKFQNFLQIGFSSSASESLKLLGYKDSELPDLLKQIKNTGLGFLCTREISEDKVEPGVGFCASCDKKLVVIDINNLTRFVATSKYLTQIESEYSSSYPLKWEMKWQPLLIFSNLVIEKVKTSPLAWMMPDAESQADVELSLGFNPILIGS